jgi:CheY-like chemotaxis protein
MSNKEDITLLLVEDDDIDAMTVQRSFQKQRIANPIVRAYDGVEALEMLRNERVSRPLIILLDLQMPRMGGIEFLTTLRADDDLKDIVVFVLTTSKSEEDLVKSYRQQIAGYFIKGEVGESFLDVVNVLDNYWKVVQLPK